MPSFVPHDPETLEDQRRYTRERLVEVACPDCLSTVGVKKNSEHHTSVQWHGDARSQCPELRRVAPEDRARSMHRGCPRLLAAIERAALDGRVPIGAEDGY